MGNNHAVCAVAADFENRITRRVSGGIVPKNPRKMVEVKPKSRTAHLYVELERDPGDVCHVPQPFGDLDGGVRGRAEPKPLSRCHVAARSQSHGSHISCSHRIPPPPPRQQQPDSPSSAPRAVSTIHQWKHAHSRRGTAWMWPYYYAATRGNCCAARRVVALRGVCKGCRNV